MENIISGVIGLLSSGWGVFARQFSPSARPVESVIAAVLWSVPLAFWIFVIRFVFKHW